jgi:biotin carboxyl carrier protein
MEFRYHTVGDEEQIRVVKIEQEGERYRITVDGRPYEVQAHRPEHGSINLSINGRRLRATVAHDGLRRHVALASTKRYVVQQPDPRARQRRRGPGAAEGGLEAAMPGQVLDVLVRAGDTVTRGQTLVLLEAMKMELRIAAPLDGQVRAVHCAAGQVVERGQILIELQAL